MYNSLVKIGREKHLSLDQLYQMIAVVTSNALNDRVDYIGLSEEEKGEKFSKEILFYESEYLKYVRLVGLWGEECSYSQWVRQKFPDRHYAFISTTTDEIRERIEQIRKTFEEGKDETTGTN